MFFGSSRGCNTGFGAILNTTEEFKQLKREEVMLLRQFSIVDKGM